MSLCVESAQSARQKLNEAWRLANSGMPARAYGLAMAAHEAARGDSRMEAETADCLADCCLKMAHYELGIGFVRIAAAIWQSQDETARYAKSYSLLAEFLSDIGAPDAVAAADEALHAAEQSGDVTARARAYMAMGLVLFMAREPDKALPFCERAVALSRAAGFAFPVAKVNLSEALILAGLQAAERGDQAKLARLAARAVSVTREALAEARLRGDGWLARLALNNIADYSLHVGDIATAEAALAEVPATVGEPTIRCQSIHLMECARLLAAKGELEAARAKLETCLEGLKDLVYLEIEMSCLGELATVLERMGRFAEALAAHRRFHAAFVRKASEGAQRLARVAAHETQARELRDAAGRAQSIAASLMRSNSELARESQRLLRASLEDVLTGLPNRRRMDLAVADLTLSESVFGLAMVDLDHFKQVNDRFSHSVGDAVLREIGHIFHRLLRRHDLAVRFGGEEFALIVRNANAKLLSRLCERLRAGVEAADWTRFQPGLAVTVSIGAALSDEAPNPDGVLKLADARLYEAKRGGRNRVVGPVVFHRADLGAAGGTQNGA